jgi:hypothetical protein
MCLALATPAAHARGEQSEPEPPAPTDAGVAAAIRKGLDYLYSAQKADGTWASKYDQQHAGGVTSLVLLTALTAGESPKQAPLAKALEAVKSVWPETVYARSVRAMVYARLGEKYAELLAKDVAWLTKQQSQFGGWGYGPRHPVTLQRSSWIDNSNTQVAAWALHEAAAAGAPVPQAAFLRLRRLWTQGQNTDGGRGYTPHTGSPLRLKASSYGSMTAASVATCQILASHLVATQSRNASPQDGPPKEVKEQLAMTQQSIKWLEEHHTCKGNPRWLWGERESWPIYYLYCLARAADAVGLRSLGKHDWYAEVASHLLAEQREDGSWAAPGQGKERIVSTCFSLLTLTTAGRRVLVNKIILPGGDRESWAAAEPYLDTANVVGWFRRTQRTPACWQLIPHDCPAEVLAEAPILYVVLPAGGRLPGKLAGLMKHFVREGGTVLMLAGGGSESESQCRKYFLGLFPDYHVGPVGDDHPLFSVRHEISPADRPRVAAIGDYCRMRVFIIGPQPALLWRAGPTERSQPAFEFFANLVRYATDGEKLKGRFASRRPAPRHGAAVKWLKVARVSHAGDWNTNPLAMRRLSETLLTAISLAVKEVDAVDLSGEVDKDLPLLWLTGSLQPRLTPRQRDNLKDYLSAGGMLFIDPAVGNDEFFAAAWKMLEESFGPGRLKPLPAEHPLITGRFAGGIGSDIRKVGYSPAVAASKPQLHQPVLYGLELDGRLAVILSRYGITCPLEGGPTFGCMGLARDDARRLAANVALYAAISR